MHPPKKYYKTNNNNGFKELDILALIALGVSIYIASLSHKNLEYNKLNAATSRVIAEELRKLNNSSLVHDISVKLANEQAQNNKGG